MFTLTEAAADRIRQDAERGGSEGLALRIAAQKKPDGSIEYRMGFDETGEEDIQIDCTGVRILMAPEHVPLLDEATLDYVELEPGQFHFIFLNPKDAHYVPPTQDG